jgi:hypothetical protein
MKTSTALTERIMRAVKSRRTRARSRRQASTGRLLFGEALEHRIALSATPIEVDTFADVVDPDDGLTSLREAVDQASANPGDDTIHLANGKYGLDLGQLSIEDASGKLTIEAPRRAVLEAQVVSRVMNILGSDVELNNITVTGGTDMFAAGIRVAGSSLSMNDGKVLNNHAMLFGGGIGVGEGSTVVLNDTQVSDNSAGISGGGIAVGNGMVPNAVNVVALSHSRVTGNSAGSGGGISLGVGANSLTLDQSKVSDNTAAAPEGVPFAGLGGGIVSLPLPGANNSVTLNASKITDNSAASFGGGIWLAGSLTVGADSKINDNDAGIAGGGVFLQAGTLDVDADADIEGNSPDDVFIVQAAIE